MKKYNKSNTKKTRKAYDRIEINVPVGMRSVLHKKAEAQGFSSLGQFIRNKLGIVMK